MHKDKPKNNFYQKKTTTVETNQIKFSFDVMP